jgi:general secretion pathway protein G
MMFDHRNKRVFQKAFTLIELLLVLVILAVLASLVVPRFAGRGEKARITAAKADIASIGLLLNTFEIDCGRYPSTPEGLQALVEAPASAKNWQGPYFENGRMPIDPWGKPYVYRCPGQHNANGYDLSSCGPDMQEGGGDDIDNWTQAQQ